MVKRTGRLSLVVFVGLASGCANVMYYQQFRPVDVEIHVPVDRPTPVLVWVPEPATAAAVVSKLETGSFSAADLGEPAKYTATHNMSIVAAADGYGVRTCGLRVLGLPRPLNSDSRPLMLVAIRIEGATTYHIFAVARGKSISAYQVDTGSEAPEVLEVISGHPASRFRRGKDRDRITLFISGLLGSTPNKRVNLSVRPVTSLAEDASAAPGQPAGYARR